MTGCEALVGAALFACVARDPVCLPPQHRELFERVDLNIAAIAEQESGYSPFALRSETLKARVPTTSRADAEQKAAALLAQGHVLGAGWFQITHSSNWARHGLTVANAFDPCANLRAGAAHFAADIRNAALQRYNSGRINGAPAYAAQVERRNARLAGSRTAPGLPATPSAEPTPPAVPDRCLRVFDAFERAACRVAVPSAAPRAPAASGPTLRLAHGD